LTLRPRLPDAEVTYGSPFGSTFVWSQLVLPMHQARLRRHGGGITDNAQQRLHRSFLGLVVHWDTFPCAHLPRASVRTSSTCCSVSPVEASTEKCASTCVRQAVTQPCYVRAWRGRQASATALGGCVSDCSPAPHLSGLPGICVVHSWALSVCAPPPPEASIKLFAARAPRRARAAECPALLSLTSLHGVCRSGRTVLQV